MVVSPSPIVLGKFSGKDNKADYEKVAFIGQALVRVRGKVTAGDLIVASELNDGTGIAVSADAITPDQFRVVVGQAWETSIEPGIKLVRVAVGLKQSDPAVSNLIAINQRQSERILALEERLSLFEARLNGNSTPARSVAKHRKVRSTPRGVKPSV